MALTFVKRSTLPVSAKGKAGSMSVLIDGNGRITLTKLATAAMNGSGKVVMGFDAGKVYIFRGDAKLVNKVDEKDKIELVKAKKGGSVSFAGAAILRDSNTFGNHIYDFKKSGNQTFAATHDEKNGCITFALPSGALTARPKAERKPRKKKVTEIANAATAGGGTQASEPELVLETA